MSGRAQGGLLLRQLLVQLADELPVAAHVLPEGRAQAPERRHVAAVGRRVQQRGEELPPQLHGPVPAVDRVNNARGVSDASFSSHKSTAPIAKQHRSQRIRGERIRSNGARTF